MPTRRRCYLVYAVAPDGVSARAANDVLNEYIGDRRRGIIVFHDHFTGKPHGGVAVWDVSSVEEQALLDDPGQLADWDVRVHPLTFALAAAGFAAQMELTIEGYAGTTLAELAAEEEDDERFWWRRR
jgi:hypothetical protein